MLICNFDPGTGWVEIAVDLVLWGDCRNEVFSLIDNPFDGVESVGVSVKDILVFDFGILDEHDVVFAGVV